MEKPSLTALVREQLELARGTSSRRSSRTVYDGHEHVLRQTLIAFAAGQTLDEHEKPGEATVQVLHGRVKLAATSSAWEGSPGEISSPFPTPGTLEALQDAAVLLMVAKS